MRLSELQTKKIININSGTNIGSIIDIIINEDGKIENLLLDHSKSIFSLNKEGDIILEWSNIVKIGEDVILVKKN